MKVLIVCLVVVSVFFGYMVVSVANSIKENEVAAIHQAVAGFSR
jgi:hypothetical protein